MDINDDGYGDILSGSYSHDEQPMIGLFQVLYGDSEGNFNEATVLNGTDGKPLGIPYDGEDDIVKGICTRPWAIDWDQDGDLDLVVGNFEGSFYLFNGEGDGQFDPTPKQIMTSSAEPLQINGAHSDPTMVDWDSDGDLDILSGGSGGGVQWSENTAGKGKTPTLSQFREIIEGSRYRENGELLALNDLEKPSTDTRIWTTDVNNDGKLDLLVGDNTTLISPADGLNTDEYHEKLSEWNAKNSALMQEWNSPGDQEERREKLTEHYIARAEFMNEDKTGFVWLYLRK